MQSSEKDDEIYDALLKVALKEAMRKKMEKLPTCEELEGMYKPSPEYEKKLRKMISRATRKGKITTFKKYFKKTVASAAIVIVILTAVLMTVEASRNYIFDTIIKWYGQYTYVELGNSGTDVNINMPRPKYIPDGFTEVQLNLNGDMKFLIYQNSDGEKIIFEQYSNESFATATDNEQKSFVETDINGNEAALFESTDGDYNILFWKYNDSVLKLMAKIDTDELIEMAKSVE
ncbi:MAG: DUF4367 domain-containing protein [Oscillospiraceae bacterium]|nr:DUF4367 domain-containing protein [Oscillospiraceae bacterium]